MARKRLTGGSRRTARTTDERRTGPAIRNQRKTMQLCRQVGETLDGVLAASEDDTLRDLQVESVVPAPDASRMLVTLRPVAGLVDPVKAMERLGETAGELRTEVAGAITRRKCPSLLFQIQQGERSGEDGESAGTRSGRSTEITVGVVDATLAVAVGYFLTLAYPQSDFGPRRFLGRRRLSFRKPRTWSRFAEAVGQFAEAGEESGRFGGEGAGSTCVVLRAGGRAGRRRGCLAGLGRI